MLKEVQVHIKAACTGGAILGAFLLGGYILARLDNSDLGYGIGPWTLAEAILVFALIIGIFMKSRVSAVLMLVYFVASKAGLFMYFLSQQGFQSLKGIMPLFIFLIMFIQGVIGTFQYHQRQR